MIYSRYDLLAARVTLIAAHSDVYVPHAPRRIWVRGGSRTLLPPPRARAPRPRPAAPFRQLRGEEARGFRDLVATFPEVARHDPLPAILLTFALKHLSIALSLYSVITCSSGTAHMSRNVNSLFTHQPALDKHEGLIV